VRVLQPETAQAVRHMLHLVTQNGGTAPKAQTMGYSWAARPAPRTSRKARATRTASTAASSSAWRPVETPRIVVAVMIDEPSGGRYFGGDVAAPVFSATVQQTLRMLGVQPDMNVKPQIVVNAVEESF
jgi:cell division protein FtsI (penicillin-binding protein 3)